MASYSSSNTETKRWEKIVEGVDSGQYPEITINEGKLFAVSSPSVASARIHSFLVDVFKDGDNSWFSSANDPAENEARPADDDGQPESSDKKKKLNLTQQRAAARQEKKDKGQVKARAEMSKDGYTDQEWMRIAQAVCTLRPPGMALEKEKLVAMDETVNDAKERLRSFVAHVLEGNNQVFLQRGAAHSLRR